MAETVRPVALMIAALLSSFAVARGAVADTPSLHMEIQRGQTAGFACMVKHPSDVVSGQECVDHEIVKNETNNTLTAGFTIGAYVEGIMAAGFKVGVMSGSETKSAATDESNRHTRYYASEIYRLQSAAGLSDQELCDITRKKCDTLIGAIKTWRGGF
jgi:hypothetical protein